MTSAVASSENKAGDNTDRSCRCQQEKLAPAHLSGDISPCSAAFAKLPGSSLPIVSISVQHQSLAIHAGIQPPSEREHDLDEFTVGILRLDESAWKHAQPLPWISVKMSEMRRFMASALAFRHRQPLIVSRQIPCLFQPLGIIDRLLPEAGSGDVDEVAHGRLPSSGACGAKRATLCRAGLPVYGPGRWVLHGHQRARPLERAAPRGRHSREAPRGAAHVGERAIIGRPTLAGGYNVAGTQGPGCVRHVTRAVLRRLPAGRRRAPDASRAARMRAGPLRER